LNAVHAVTFEAW